ncbi:unnamed protein product [Ambrosiozyma monospora]|uniref:Unnamed protein product n=1 Tax=Ambrosiozyma monospora TaxID=43982 RepID=A0A9W6Z282_AMBMO|nr:unnamed protein product [Ambrosiozyma monospora]
MPRFNRHREPKLISATDITDNKITVRPTDIPTFTPHDPLILKLEQLRRYLIVGRHFHSQQAALEKLQKVYHRLKSLLKKFKDNDHLLSGCLKPYLDVFNEVTMWRVNDIIRQLSDIISAPDRVKSHSNSNSSNIIKATVQKLFPLVSQLILILNQYSVPTLCLDGEQDEDDEDRAEEDDTEERNREAFNQNVLNIVLSMDEFHIDTQSSTSS